ncbi:MAG: TIR domain-containing protein [Phycisphaerae bacterium]|jgi:WD40 repeat protein|nr:TIR domain-containing protein [Phycisphaerae bacterium]
MTEDGTVSDTAAYQYDAFISYRHLNLDRKWAKWLHSALETYRVPKKLVRQKNIAPRIKRVFRDEDEMPASADLNQEIETALRASRFLIVICSRRTPESEWIGKEIERFHELGRGDRILAMLIDGEPREAFPDALRKIRPVVTEGTSIVSKGIEEVEPLAADVRPIRTESPRFLKRMAKLRMLACLLGCSFDDLRRREDERHRRRMTAIATVATVLLLIMGGLTTIAIRQTSEARRQRASADRQRRAAEKAERVSSQRLISNYVAQGWRLHKDNDLSGALALFVEAFRLDAEGSARNGEWICPERAHRIRVGHMFRRLPQLRLLDIENDSSVVGASMSQDHTRIALIRYRSESYKVYVRDIDTGHTIHLPIKHGQYIKNVAFSSDRDRLMTVSDKSVSVWDLKSRNLAFKPLQLGDRIETAGFGKRYGRIVVWTQNKDLLIWEARTGKRVLKPGPMEETIDRERDLTGRLKAKRNTVQVSYWGGGDEKLSVTLLHPYKVRDAFINWGEKSFVTLCGPVAYVWSLPPVKGGVGTPFQAVKPGGNAASVLARSPNEQYVLTEDNDGVIQVWDGNKPQRICGPSPLKNRARFTRFSSDSESVVIMSAGQIRVWNVRTGQPRTPALYGFNVPICASFSPDGKRIVASGLSGRAYVWDCVTPEQGKLELLHGAPAIAHVEFSPDGSRIVTAGNDGVAWIWDAQTGKQIQPPLRHRSDASDRYAHVREAKFSPDGKRVVTASDDGTVRIWDAESHRMIAAPVQHTGYLASVIFDPRGAILATGSYDKTARIWETNTGLPVSPPLPHTQTVMKVAFRTNSTQLMTVSDNEPQVWDISPDERPLRVLAALSEITSGRKVGENGGLLALEPEELLHAWKQINNRE